MAAHSQRNAREWPSESLGGLNRHKSMRSLSEYVRCCYAKQLPKFDSFEQLGTWSRQNRVRLKVIDKHIRVNKYGRAVANIRKRHGSSIADGMSSAGSDANCSASSELAVQPNSPADCRTRLTVGFTV